MAKLRIEHGRQVTTIVESAEDDGSCGIVQGRDYVELSLDVAKQIHEWLWAFLSTLDASGGRIDPHPYIPHVLPGAPKDRCHECGHPESHALHSALETPVEQPKCNGLCRGHNTELSTAGWLPDVNCPVHGLKAMLTTSNRGVNHDV